MEPPIVGGSEAPAGRWESVASVRYAGAAGCSGVLIHPELVLTAGHCVAETLDSVALGGIDLDDPDTFELVEVSEIHLYEDHWNTHDVAVLVLAEPAETPVAPLAIGCAERWLVDGAEAQVLGFGNTDSDGGGATSLLHEAALRVEVADCQDASRGCNVGYSDVIAGGDGVDTCVGDSGGPLFLWGDGDPHLAGTTSRAALPQSRTCGDGGIYVGLAGVSGWIEGVTGQSLEQPDCDFVNTPPEALAFSIQVAVGESAEFLLEVEDPDEGQGAAWSIAAPTAFAEASVDGASLFVEGLRIGADVLLLEVDDGFDVAELEVPVVVTSAAREAVVDPEPRNGCSTGPGSSAWALLAVLALRVRRRA